MSNIAIPIVDNFRSLDGYVVADGRCVRSGMLYRSARLDGLTREGQEMLKSMPIKTIVDFRNNEECQMAPTPDLGGGVVMESLPIIGGDLSVYISDIMAGKLSQADVEQLMCDMYRGFVTDCSNQYARFFDILLYESSYPILFHCMAGKDRTGFAAAVLLSLLGVNRQDIQKDYLITNDNLSGMKNSKWFKLIPHAQVLMCADERYINASFDAIQGAYGSIEGYFDKGLGISAEKQELLKSLLLE